MSKDGYVYDNYINLGCGSCRYFQCDAERRDCTTCKRIDHKHFKFGKPWFKSYDCGQQSAITCADFEPKESCKWLCDNWVSIDDYMSDYELIEGKSYLDNKFITICIDDDFSVRYYIRRKDFHYNTFVNADGTLKWIKRCYYKQSRKSTIGYKLIWEFNEKELTDDEKIVYNV